MRVGLLKGREQFRLVGDGERFRWRDDRNMDLEIRPFRRREGWKAPVAEGRRERVLRDVFDKRALCLETSYTAAQAAFYERIPVGHIEAGLRTDPPVSVPSAAGILRVSG